MKKLLLLAGSLCLLAPALPLFAQSLDYRQEDAPAISWNPILFHDARGLACAGVSFLRSAAVAGAGNPAMRGLGGGWNFLVSGYAAMYQNAAYWGFNEGLYYFKEDVMSRRQSGWSSVAVSGSWGDWRISAGYRYSAIHSFPDFARKFNYSSSSYEINGLFSGQEQAILAGLSRSFGAVTAGLRLEYRFSSRKAYVEEKDTYFASHLADLTATAVEQNGRQFIPALGLTLHVAPTFDLGLALEWPINGTMERIVTPEFYYQTYQVRIKEAYSFSDRLEQPKRLTFSGAWNSPERSNQTGLTLAWDVDYALWKSCQVEFFAAVQPLILRNTVGFAIGGEYRFPLGRQDILSIRAGFKADAQPPILPKQTLSGWSLGLGNRLGAFTLDLGVWFSGCTMSFEDTNRAFINRKVNHWIWVAGLGIQL